MQTHTNCYYLAVHGGGYRFLLCTAFLPGLGAWFLEASSCLSLEYRVKSKSLIFPGFNKIKAGLRTHILNIYGFLHLLALDPHF